MGFFYEENELEKKYKALIKAIKNLSKNDAWAMKYFLNYVNDIRDGNRNNDFFDFDFLTSVILECLNDSRPDKVEIFEKVIKLTKFLLPMGKETEGYEAIKQTILNGNNFIDSKLYALFDNRLDYMQIVNIIKEETVFLENYGSIVNYGLEVSPYCVNSSVLKSELLSYMYGLKSEYGSIANYFDKKLTEAKKRCGIYPIDEKSLALIASEARKAQNLVKKLEIMQKKVDEYNESINATVKSGKKEIADEADLRVKEMQQSIELVQKDIVDKLDQYLINLEINLKNSSDQVFKEFIQNTQSKIRDIRLAAQSLSTTTTQELLRIQKASEESVAVLKQYVESEPNLQKYLKEAESTERLKEALLKLDEIKTERNNSVTVTSEVPGIIIPGNDRLVVPASPKVVLPNGNVDPTILPAFNENIPFDVRYKAIMEKKKIREDNGELFHSMIDEVISCVMEGDWVYLYGPSGCGKSHLMRQVASLLGIEYVDNGKITDKYSVMAYNDPHGRFRATQTFVALLYGKLLGLDEFDNGNPDTQVVLNELYSGLLDVLEKPAVKRYITFAEDMTVPIHPNFRMISAGNTSGEGENQLFSSRGKLDEAIQERMTPKKFDYDNRVEKRIFGDYNNWYQLFVNFRKACDSYAIRRGLPSAPGMITTRDASAIVKYIRHNSKSVDQVLQEKFIQIKDEDYLRTIANVLSNIYSCQGKDIKISESTRLGEVEEWVLAKKLIYGCNKAMNRTSM